MNYITNYKTTYRKGLAVSLLLLIFIIDIAAVRLLFSNYLQLALFGAVLGIQTLLMLAYHQRCLECEGCMEKASAGIYLFYKVFAAIGFFSMLLILLADVLPIGNRDLKIAVAITYAALLITGVSTAFKAIIGVRNFSECGSAQAEPAVPEVGSEAEETESRNQTFRDEASQREQDTLNGWQEAETKKRTASQEKQQQQSLKRKAAREKAKKTDLNGSFKFPDTSRDE